MRRIIFIPILIFLALAAIGGAIAYLIYDNYIYYNTDDAQVTGQIVSISAPGSGILSALSVKPGDSVSQGQTIGQVTLAPTQANASGATVNLTSPMNGTILEVPAVLNQAVGPGLQIATLTNLSTLTITAYVDENSINNVSVGQSVDIHIDAYSDTSFTGHVMVIVQAAAGQFSLLPNQDPTSGNFTKVGQRIPVIISLDGNGGKDVVPGMSAEVTIHLH